MKYMQSGFYLGILLLALASGCAPVNMKPPPLPNVAVPVGPIFVPTSCVPVVASIDKVTSFCANPALGLGGTTFTDTTSVIDNHVAPSGSNPDNISCSAQSPTVCSGPQNAKFQALICTSCGAPDTLAGYGNYVCANGFIKSSGGGCMPTGSIVLQNDDPCPPGSHFKNEVQNCIDDVTQKPVFVCPPGFPYFIPTYYFCTAKPVPVIVNCQAFPLQLGACAVKKVPGAGKGGGSQCPPGQSYVCNQLTGTCSCK
jgi:hypothetical protein